ncbi:hypothetical protein UFOVP379_2 [uncultured Caudovirales phage]|uniref:Uncharacterized protein n=1 Tax=uncultured Caudovirales phage TaxID=2100421 RepID=A0A6J7X501_9CAUD|nr:hypothetical protein UFOVP379_2 [uncultured Caudovirales phage]
MATADEYAAWIVKNSAKRGTPEFETVAQAYQIAKAEETTARTQQQLAPAPQPPSALDQLIGAGETALTIGTGLTGGTLGTIVGTGKGLTQQILSGEFGTPEAVRAVEKAAVEGAQALTYQPRTETGQEMVQATGQFLGEVLPPVLPVIATPTATVQAIKSASPILQATAQRGTAAAKQAAQATGQAIAKPVQAATTVVREALGMETPATTTTTGGRVSVGAAATPADLQRVTTAEQLGFVGPAGLTAGQRTRNFADLQFEKETAKLGEVGAPLRERVSNQTANLIQQFDAMVDRAEPMLVDARDIGKAVDKAVVTKAEVSRRKVRNAYTKAEEDGSMLEPVTLNELATTAVDVQRFEGVAPNVAPIRKEAIRLGILTEDADGNLIAQAKPIGDTELLRQFTNEVTDWTDKRQSLMARKINSAIDAGTEGKGGESYKAARKLRQDFANEFENVGLTAKLLSTKRGTDERTIAFDDIFDKIIINAPLEEMNKVRKTLLTAGPEGKQAWNELKSNTIRYIINKSLSTAQRDERGQPLVSPDKLNSVIRSLDREGKLEGLYGKKQAQQIRDLGEIAIDIYTAPPGAINFSNTASALQVALDSVMTFGLTGIPAPAVTALREASKYLKNREVRNRVRQSLQPLGE